MYIPIFYKVLFTHMYIWENNEYVFMCMNVCHCMILFCFDFIFIAAMGFACHIIVNMLHRANQQLFHTYIHTHVHTIDVL